MYYFYVQDQNANNGFEAIIIWFAQLLSNLLIDKVSIGIRETIRFKETHIAVWYVFIFQDNYTSFKIMWCLDIFLNSTIHKEVFQKKT